MSQETTVKSLGDIFCYERGNDLITYYCKGDTVTVQKVAKEIAADLAVFVSARKWNGIELDIMPNKVRLANDGDIWTLSIGVKQKHSEPNMRLMDAISDVEDLIDAVVHEIEDFDSIYICLEPSK